MAWRVTPGTGGVPCSHGVLGRGGGAGASTRWGMGPAISAFLVPHRTLRSWASRVRFVTKELAPQTCNSGDLALCTAFETCAEGPGGRLPRRRGLGFLFVWRIPDLAAYENGSRALPAHLCDPVSGGGVLGIPTTRGGPFRMWKPWKGIRGFAVEVIVCTSTKGGSKTTCTHILMA